MSLSTSSNAPAEDRLSRLVALGAVVATLLAGLVAFLLVDASGKADKAGQDADRLGLASMGELTRAMADAETDYELLLANEQQRTHEALAFQEGLFLSGPEGLGPRLAQDRWAEVADRSAQVVPPDLLARHGPEFDPAFPERYFASVTEKAVRLAARQDAANEVEALWGAKVSQYIAIITMFGVALYLFALLSVSIQTDIKRLFAVVAAVLLGGGSLWTVAVAAGRVDPAPRSAAEEFAKGHIALATAHEPAAYARAIAHYDNAIDQRGTFARALYERAKAHHLSGSLQSSGVSVLSSHEALETLTSEPALDKATRDLKKAHALGLETGPVLGQLGFNTFLQALLRGEPGLLDDSVTYTQEAIELDDGEPVWHYNLGLALLAQGRYSEASQEYTAAIDRTLFGRGDREEPREDELLLELLEAEALTNLELLEAETLGTLGLLGRLGDEELDEHVGYTKGRIVASLSAGVPTTPHSRASASGLHLEVLPSEARVTVEGSEGIDPAEDAVSVQLYYHDRSHHAAYVLPEASGEVDDAADLVSGVELQYLSRTTPPRCLPDGKYRLDLYVNGRLVGQDFDTADFGDLHRAAAAPDLDIGTCVPHDWRHSAKSMPGFVYGHATPDGSRGAFLFRFDVHEGVKHVNSAGFADAAVDLALDRPLPPAVTRPLTAEPFVGLNHPLTRSYRSGPESAEARVGIDEEGAAVVALVHGPADFVAGSRAAAILDSVFLYEPVGD